MNFLIQLLITFSAFAILSSPVSATFARASSIGGGFTAIADDLAAMEWNPAGLTRLTASEIEVFYMFSDEPIRDSLLFSSLNPSQVIKRKAEKSLVRYSLVSFAEPLSSNLIYGMQLTNEQFNADGYSISGPVINGASYNYTLNETISFNNLLFLAGAYRFSDEFSLGVKFKLFDQKNSELMKLQSLSALYSVSDKLNIGAVIDSDIYSIHRGTKLGAAYKLFDGNLTVAANAGFETIDAGAEWLPWRSIAFRAGYTQYHSLRDVITGHWSEGLNLGCGIKLGSCGIDYSYSNKPLYYINDPVPLGSGAETIDSSRKSENGISLYYRFNEFTLLNKTYLKWKSHETRYYPIETNVMREIPVSIYHLFSERGISVIHAEITNNTPEEAIFSLRYGFEFEKTKEVKNVTIPAGLTEKLNLTPSIPHEYAKKINVMPTPSTIFVEVHRITEFGVNRLLYGDSFNVVLLPYDQFVSKITDADGRIFDLMDTLANWVTYNDKNLAAVLSRAGDNGSKLNPPVKLIGFQSPDAFNTTGKEDTGEPRAFNQKDSDYLAQVKLLYDTLKEDYKIIYLNQPVAYRNSQRIKLPSETLNNKGNCVELSVLFASLLEAIEIDPIIVIFVEDRHTCVGWRVENEDKRVYHLLDTNRFGESFSEVSAGGDRLVETNMLTDEFKGAMPFNKYGIYNKNSNILVLDIKTIRKTIPPSPLILDK